MPTDTSTPVTTSGPVKKRRFAFPHTYAIIFGMIFLIGLATYLIPSGSLDRAEQDGREVVLAGTYHGTEKTPLSFFDFFTSVPTGLAEAADIIFYIFLLGGAFGVIRATGAIDAGINALVKLLHGHGAILLPLLMVVFSVLGFTTGMAEETIIFAPIGVGIALALGYDALVGAAVICLGAAAGFTGGMMNPFTVGVAQGIAQLPLFSGMGFRAILYVFILAAGIWWVMRYASRVKADPTKSLLYDKPGAPEVGAAASAAADTEAEAEDAAPRLDWRRSLVLIIFVAGIVTNMYGILKHGWFLNEMAAMFVLIAIVTGLIGRLGVNGLFSNMVSGMQDVAFGALIVGFARAILVVLEHANVLDTVINAVATWIGDSPNFLVVILMFLFQSVLNLVIPSGSGMAATTMPIMVPLSDVLGIDRQLTVLAYQYGDAIANSIMPTSASVMGLLAVCRIPYETWCKFLWPLIVFWSLIAIVALIFGSLVGVGF
ncbi:TIGR00366 family protein [Brevibacterium sp. 91QC2O2]|uniref:YfcC family protein n=1 Tax=Brevibacterium sp. 91QC2O2 TaxID=2968458 RepID=UPI00211BDE9B|nr:TIGR00366 family protein [Brevibacterium sp. 91QC2O2]MCQ9367177.1 TIGR00366 family protein [Brevibacterium sp. 91QC2O2]